MIILALIILGLIVGSFLNVVIYRLPIMILDEEKDNHKDKVRINLCLPRSRCPDCRTALRWHELIPIISFLWQRCRCRHCGGVISWQYPAVELSYAVLLVLSYVCFGWSATALAVGVLNAILLVMWVIDFQRQLLFDALTLAGLWLGLLFSALGGFVTAEESILAAVLGYVLLRFVADAYRWCRKQEGMGSGDMKLMAMLGAWFGFHALFILMGGVLMALLVSLSLLLTKRIEWRQRIAFGPFLIAAAWLWLFYFRVADVSWMPFLLT